MPKVRQGKHEVKGPLDSDIIRRIVRAHINEVRSCYNQGLKKDPTLAGSISVQFTIDAKGTVSASSAVEADAFPDPTVPACVAKTIENWKFPKPRGGGDVEVLYPFSLEPG